MNGEQSGYLNSARKLRETIARNFDDNIFASNPNNEIVYIFDTNIFIFYADLADRKRLSVDFDALVGQRSAEHIEKIMERVTAEYLFSQRLPGQHGPCFVSAQHFAEITAHCDLIAKRLSADEGLWRAISSNTEKITALLSSDSSTEHKLAKLSDIVPALWLDQLNKADHFIRISEELFLSDAPQLAPLDRTEWGNEASQLRVPDVFRWKQKLKRKKHIDNDAETLATIVNLYTKFGKTEKGKRRFLFITADNVLRRVVEAEKVELEMQGIPVFVRSPADYLPLVNLASIREAALPNQTSTETREQLASVFKALTEALEPLDDDSVVASKTTKQTSGKIDLVVKELQQSWTKASEMVGMLSASYFQVSEGALEGLKAFVLSPETTSVATKLIEQSVNSVRDKHLVLSLKSALAVAKSLRKSSSRYGGHRVNTKIIGLRFDGLVPPELSLAQFLERSLDKGLPPSVLEKLAAEPNNPEYQLFSACVFTVAERWQTASQYARRAQERRDSVRVPVLRREAAYLHALCLRLSLETPDQYNIARDILIENRRIASTTRSLGFSSFLSEIRDRVELGTLRTSAAILQELSKEKRADERPPWGLTPFISEKFVSTIFSMGAKSIREAFAELADSEAYGLNSLEKEMPGTYGSDVVRWIKLQALFNLCGAYIFAKLLPQLSEGQSVEFSSQDVALLDELIEEERQLGREKTYVHEVYLCVFAAISATSPQDMHATAARALSLFRGIESGGARLPLCDEVEFDFLAQAMLNQEKAARALLASSP